MIADAHEVPLGTGMLDLPRIVATLRRANPAIVFNLEMATRDPLTVPCLTEGYFATFPERKATHLEAAMRLVKLNPPKQALSGLMRELAEASESLPLDEPDRADENTLNRIVWHAVKGPDAPYPAAYAGAHGKGLKKLHLRFDAAARDDDD